MEKIQNNEAKLITTTLQGFMLMLFWCDMKEGQGEKWGYIHALHSSNQYTAQNQKRMHISQVEKERL